MARIRSIKPELWRNRHVMNLSHPARLLFVGLITQADDEGRGIADPRHVRAMLFPCDDDVTVSHVAAWLAECVAQFLIVIYDGGAKHGELYELTGWLEHQKISHPSGSKFPARPNGAIGSGTFRNVPEDSGSAPEHSVNAPKSDPLIGSDRIGEDLSLNLLATSARTRAKPERTILKNGSDAGKKPKKVLQRSGHRNEPRAGPGRLIPIAEAAEMFAVEHTPEWAKVPS